MLLTPKGSEFGENDLEIKYSNYNGKTQIKEVRVRRRSDSYEGKDQFKNDCVLFSSAISAPYSKFINSCVEKAFPGQSVKTIDDFYEKLGSFKLKDYEKMAATEPGCIQLSNWAADGTAAPPTPEASGGPSCKTN
jgi:hypothetical protein